MHLQSQTLINSDTMELLLGSGSAEWTELGVPLVFRALLLVALDGLLQALVEVSPDDDAVEQTQEDHDQAEHAEDAETLLHANVSVRDCEDAHKLEDKVGDAAEETDEEG